VPKVQQGLRDLQGLKEQWVPKVQRVLKDLLVLRVQQVLRDRRELKDQRELKVPGVHLIPVYQVKVAPKNTFHNM
jgi:hypothetical protein